MSLGGCCDGIQLNGEAEIDKVVVSSQLDGRPNDCIPTCVCVCVCNVRCLCNSDSKVAAHQHREQVGTVNSNLCGVTNG